MCFTLSLVFLIFSIHSNVLSAELPSDIKKCPYGNLKCIADSMNDFIRRYPKGISEIGLNPLDNLKTKNFLVAKPQLDRPVWLSYNILNHSYYGFENTTITEVVGFERDPTKTPLEISGIIPSLKRKYTYETAGRLLLFHYNSTGTANSDLQNFQFTLKLKVQIEFRNNKRYLKIYDLVPSVTLDRWIIWVDNLYTENFDMTFIINQVINDNWLEIWNEWEPIMLEGFSEAFFNLLGSFFNEVAYDDLFLQNKFTT